MCLSTCCYADNEPHNRAEEEKKAAEDKKESKFDPQRAVGCECLQCESHLNLILANQNIHPCNFCWLRRA